MEPQFYESKLAGHQIFKDLSESLKGNPSGKLRNLVELNDDVFYAWNSYKNCLFCLNLKHLEENEEDTPYQRIDLVSPPVFQVERLLSSPCGTKLCLWGSRGACIVDLPSRWGRGGLFESGSQNILCKNYSIDERFLYAQGEVRRIHWHPESLSHVLVLISDNTIRLYNIALKCGPRVVKVIPIGPKPKSLLAGKTILESLGDTAVDFTPLPNSDSMLVLQGNGDVYHLECELENESSVNVKFSGPLSMLPPADDNYGSESCSIVALGGSNAPLIVVGTCEHALYHCVLLRNSTDNKDDDNYTLYVVETVDLSVQPASEEDLQFSYPVLLYPSGSCTYTCLHARGLHAVHVPLLAQLRDYGLSQNSDLEASLTAMCAQQSFAREMVRTVRTTGVAPPVGVVTTQPPLSTVLVLCADGDLCHRALEPLELEEQLYGALQLRNRSLDQDDISRLLREKQKISFTAIIKEILTRETSQPLLKLNKKEASLTEMLELLTEASVRLHTEYMRRHQRVSDALVRKLEAIRALAANQGQWKEVLLGQVDSITKRNEMLSLKYEQAEKQQEYIQSKCSGIIRRLHGSTWLSADERVMLVELENYNKRCEGITTQIAAMKLHTNNKEQLMKAWNEDYRRKDTALGKPHSDTVQTVLQQQSKLISSLVDQAKQLKQQLRLV